METINSRLINWASILDDKTREQALATARLPFIYPHLALMPDAHLGKGATVGSVIPTLGAIIPAAVGVDIGCGMIAVRTQYAAEGPAQGPETAAGGHRARHSAVRRPQQPQDHRHRRTAASPSCGDMAAKAGFEPGPVRGEVGAAAGIAGLGQPLHRGVRGRDRRRLAVPALRLPRRRQQDRAAPHRRGPSWSGAGTSSCRTRTWPTWRKAPPNSTATSRSSAGPSTSPC